MKLTRSLSPSFISALNDLYTNGKSWWRKIVDDKDVFVLLRNNEIRAQVNGGLLLQINQAPKGNIICRVHEEFLNLRSPENPYVIIDATSSG